MSIHTDIVSALSGIASGNLYPQFVPEKIDFPFVVYRRLSKEPFGTIHDGVVHATRSVFVFECYSRDMDEAISIAALVRTALTSSSPTLECYEVTTSGEDFEPAVDAFMEPVQFEFWH